MTNIVLDVTPTRGSTSGYNVSMAQGPSDTTVSIGSNLGNVHRTISFGYETLSEPGLQNATIRITNGDKTIGTVRVGDINAAIGAGNSGVLSNYAQALLNGDGRNFPTFAREEQARLEAARAEFEKSEKNPRGNVSQNRYEAPAPGMPTKPSMGR